MNLLIFRILASVELLGDSIRSPHRSAVLGMGIPGNRRIRDSRKQGVARAAGGAGERPREHTSTKKIKIPPNVS
jgi:hypothetical protein